MSSVIVRTTFQTHLQAAYPNMELVAIDNVNVVAPKDLAGKLKPFLGVFYLATEDARGIGRHWRESGTINLLIYALAGRGAPAEMADELRNLFAGRDLQVPAPGVRLALLDANPLTPYLGGAGSVSGVYSVGMIAIAYQYDFNR